MAARAMAGAARASSAAAAAGAARGAAAGAARRGVATTTTTAAPAAAAAGSRLAVAAAAAAAAAATAVAVTARAGAEVPVAHAAGTPAGGVPGTNKERTFIAIKPDGVQRGLVSEIIKRFEQKGFKLVAIKMIWPSKEFAEKHYADLAKKPFFPGMIKYFTSGPVVAMVWEGRNAALTGRVLLGETDPAASKPGSIRGDFAMDLGRNICHGSDSPESAQAEIALWFGNEVHDWDAQGYSNTYEK